MRGAIAVWILRFLFTLGCFGLLTSTAFLGMVVVAAARFARRKRRLLKPNAVAMFTPQVSLLKPLHGAEPELERNLRSFFEQDYPAFEILFCARQADDAGLTVARRVAADYSAVPARFLACGEPPYPNAKVFSLAAMERAAANDILIVSDSDVRVHPTYLREIMRPFSNSNVGLVTCLYRGVALGDPPQIWARLEAIGMSIEMTSGALAAQLIEPVQFALGPTMAVRRQALDQIGGFRSMGWHCSDDFLLGNRVAEQGWLCVISESVIDHTVLNVAMSNSLSHQVRWMKSTRFSRPKGHLGTALTFSIPFGVLALVSGLLLDWKIAAISVFAAAIANRLLQAWVVGSLVVAEPNIALRMWLYPLRDFLGFCFWLASYANSKINWRGQQFELYGDGRMRPVGKHES